MATEPRTRTSLFISAVHPDLLPPVHNMAQVHSANGFQVNVLSFGYSKSSNIEYRVGNISYVIKHVYQGSAIGKLWRQFQFFLALRELKKRSPNYNWIFVFCPVSFFWGSFLFGSNRLVVHWIEIYERPRAFGFDFIFFKYFRRKIHSARAIVAPSVGRSEHLYRMFELKDKPGVLLNAPFAPHVFPACVRTDSERVRIIHTGGVNDSRGLVELLHGYHLVDQSEFDLFITNFSKEDYSKELARIVHDKSLRNVHFLPTLSREQLRNLQKSADIGVCFLKRIGTLDTELIAPNKLGEYLLNGLVCLVSDQEYFRGFNKPSFLISVEITNPEHIAEGLLRARQLVRQGNYRDDLEAFLSNEYNMQVQMERNCLTA